jgi:hypothetical protein
LPVKRVREVMDWVRAGEFDRIVAGTYPRRGDPMPPPRAAAGEAADHYAERFRGAFPGRGRQRRGRERAARRLLRGSRPS